MNSLFDTVARTMAAQIPRRQALRDVVKLLVGAVFLGLVAVASTSTFANIQADVRPQLTKSVTGEFTANNAGDDMLASEAPAKPLRLQKCALENCSDTPQNTN